MPLLKLKPVGSVPAARAVQPPPVVSAAPVTPVTPNPDDDQAELEMLAARIADLRAQIAKLEEPIAVKNDSIYIEPEEPESPTDRLTQKIRNMSAKELTSTPRETRDAWLRDLVRGLSPQQK